MRKNENESVHHRSDEANPAQLQSLTGDLHCALRPSANRVRSPGEAHSGHAVTRGFDVTTCLSDRASRR